MAKRKVATKSAPPITRESFAKLPAGVQKELKEIFGREFGNVVANGLGDAIFGPGPNQATPMVSRADTLFKNNRWYLVSNMRQLLSEIYVELGLVRTVCDVPVDDALRGGVTLTSKQASPEEIEEIRRIMDTYDDLGIVAQAHKWKRLFGGGGVVIVTGQNPSTPLNIEALHNKQLAFRAVDMWELFWTKQNTSDYSAVIDMDFSSTQIEYNYYGINLNGTRVMKLIGDVAPSFVRPRLRGWGMSIMETLVRPINQYLKSTDLMFEVLDEFKVDIYKFKDLKNALLGPKGNETVMQRVTLANKIKNYLNAVVLDADDDFNSKELHFAGIGEAMRSIKEQVAADIRMPLTKIFGISAQGFSSGEDDIENYNAMIESSIRKGMKGEILSVAKLRFMQKYGYIPEDLNMEFKPLRILSAEQEENVKTQQFSRVLQARQAGEITSEEFRDSVNTANLLPIKLDTSPKVMREVQEQNDQQDQAETKGVPAPKAAKGKLNAPEAKTVKNDANMLFPEFTGAQIVSVGLVSGDEVLTGLRADNNKWTFPGGHMDAGEDVKDAAVREVLEESGIQISRQDLVHISSTIQTGRNDKQFALHLFKASIPKKPWDVSDDPDSEFKTMKWVKISPETEELKPENRHAVRDDIVAHLLEAK